MSHFWLSFSLIGQLLRWWCLPDSRDQPVQRGLVMATQNGLTINRLVFVKPVGGFGGGRISAGLGDRDRGLRAPLHHQLDETLGSVGIP